MAIEAGGCYAEYVAVHERQLLAIPASVATEDGAAIPEVFLTAWDALVAAGRADQRAVGARARRGVGRRHRGDPDGQGDRRAHRRHLLGGQGQRVPRRSAPTSCSSAHRTTGRPTPGRGARRVRHDPRRHRRRRGQPQPAGCRARGTIVQVGLMGGGSTNVNVGLLLGQAGRTGSARRCAAGRSRRRSPWCGASLRRCCRCSTRGLLHPVIHGRYPLGRIAEAHVELAANATVGKILESTVRPATRDRDPAGVVARRPVRRGWGDLLGLGRAGLVRRPDLQGVLPEVASQSIDHCRQVSSVTSVASVASCQSPSSTRTSTLATPRCWAQATPAIFIGPRRSAGPSGARRSATRS